VTEQKSSSEYLNKLTSSAPENKLPEWRDEIEKAEKERNDNPESMDVMKNRLVKGINGIF
jgi:hypothetical protein